MSGQFRALLLARAGLAAVEVTPKLAADLETYYQLLTRWNARINLTGLDPAAPETLDRLLIEPLAAARHIPAQARSLIDIGSGGGSPAVPMALAAGVRLTMVESKVRKSVFLREVLRELRLNDSEVLNDRYETLLSQSNLVEAFDVLSIRAVRQEPAALNELQRFVVSGGTLLLFRRDYTWEWPAGSPASHRPEVQLTFMATHPLVSSLQSQVVVLMKDSNVPQ